MLGAARGIRAGCHALRDGSPATSPARTTAHWDSFLDGHSRLRAVKDADLAALSWFAVVSGISDLAFHLNDKPAFAGAESVSEGWAEDELAGLRAGAGDLP